MTILFDPKKEQRILDSQLYSKFMYCQNLFLKIQKDYSILYEKLNESISYNKEKGFEKSFLLRDLLEMALLKFSQNSDTVLDSLSDLAKIKILAK